MSKTLEFKAFCFEAYKAEKQLTGRQTMHLTVSYPTLKAVLMYCTQQAERIL